MDYINEAHVTLSDKFHGEKVHSCYLTAMLDAVVRDGRMLDQLKKAIFYGRDLPTTPQKIDSLLPVIYEFDKDQQFPLRLHAILGIITEAAELGETLISGIRLKRFDDVNIAEEIGDILWYMAVLLRVIGSDFETEMHRNILKLRLRYPDKFSEYDANNRDLGKERKILEKDLTNEAIKPTVNSRGKKRRE